VNHDPSALETFRFRDIHARLFLGTMSDRYSGWLGQIYTPERYQGRITSRPKNLRGRRFVEEVLPVESVSEYFEHFPVLEMDFTFYRPLLDPKGEPTPNYHVLRAYRQHMSKKDRVFVKVPQSVCARKLFRGGAHVPNPDYLDADLYTNQFYEPACTILGETLHGLIFEQEYQRRDGQTAPARAAEEWDRFFSDIPPDPRRHLEIRTERLLGDSLFGVLEKHGVGQVLSHWTWLPSLRRQAELSEGGLRSEDGAQVIRLVTPRRKTYEETYSAAFPFDAMVEGMLHESTVEETVEIIRGVVQRGSRLYLFINNRAGGNAPLIAQRIAREFKAGEDAPPHPGPA
jgi:hypothetical protein